jgi:hypothetical protein
LLQRPAHLTGGDVQGVAADEGEERLAVVLRLPQRRRLFRADTGSCEERGGRSSPYAAERIAPRQATRERPGEIVKALCIHRASFHSSTVPGFHADNVDRSLDVG